MLGAHPETRSAVKRSNYVSSPFERPGGLATESQTLMWESY